MRLAALFLAMVPIAAAQQSAQVTVPWPAGHPVVTLPNAAPWTTIGSRTNPMRWELRVQDFGPDFPAYPSALVGLGPVSLNQGVRSGLIQATNVFTNLDAIYNNGPQVGFTGGDLLIRGVGKVVDPYIGIGLGLSLNSIQSPFMYMLSGNSVTTLDDFGVGFIFRIPVGMRIKLDPKTQMDMELRYELNSVAFSRGISGESDNILVQGVRFVGVSPGTIDTPMLAASCAGWSKSPTCAPASAPTAGCARPIAS